MIDLTPHPQDIWLGSSWEHWLGTDSLGRDVLHRLLVACGYSLSLSFLATLLSLTISVFVGFYLGWNYRKNLFYFTFKKILDLLTLFPSILLLMVLSVVFQKFFINYHLEVRTYMTLFLSLALTHWMNSARVIELEVVRLNQAQFIEASKALGATRWHLLIYHIQSALKSQLKILFGLQMAQMILSEGGLSFMGFGFQPPAVSLGLLVHEGWAALGVRPELVFYPAICIFLIVGGFQFYFSRKREII